MKKFLIISLTAYLSLIFLMPKENLFFTLEKFLAKEKVVISNESHSDNLISLSVRNAEVSYDKLAFGNIEKISAYPLIFVNYLSISDTFISNDFKNMFPRKIDSITALYSIFYPFKVLLSFDGDFGEASGSIDIKDRLVQIELTPSEKIKKNRSFMGKFKKVEDKFIYEYRY